MRNSRDLPLLLTLGLGVFAGALDLGVLSPALPRLAEDFGVATGDSAWVFTLYLLVIVASIAIAGVLADRYGRRVVYIACVATFAVGSLLAILAPSYPVFLLARALQALGAGGIFPVAVAAIGDVVPENRRGAALGLVAATWGLAAIIGPTFGGIVTHFVSWRWIFAFNIPLALAVIWLARTHVPSIAPHVRGALDKLGLATLCLGLLGLTYGITATRWPIALLGLIVLGLFVFIERSSPNPIVPPALFATPQLIKTYSLEIAIGILEGSLFFIPTVLVGAQGLSYMAAGFVAALGAVTFVAVIPAAGRALDRIGSRDVLIGGALCTEVGLAIFALGFGSIWLSLLAMIVAGVGFGALLGAPTRYIVTNATKPATRATAVGLLSQALIVGQILGGSIAGGVMNAAQSIGAGYRDTYLIFAAVALVALGLTITLADRATERAINSPE
ncbi:MAG: MFS transporter [Candidatus Eremiobacteraeota bacterium]|nr:MFS transporter [Candidatus Eremiobacteraeota bacterium]